MDGNNNKGCAGKEGRKGCRGHGRRRGDGKWTAQDSQDEFGEESCVHHDDDTCNLLEVLTLQVFFSWDNNHKDKNKHFFQADVYTDVPKAKEQPNPRCNSNEAPCLFVYIASLRADKAGVVVVTMAGVVAGSTTGVVATTPFFWRRGDAGARAEPRWKRRPAQIRVTPGRG